MKRTPSLFSCLLLATSLCACGGSETHSADDGHDHGASEPAGTGTETETETEDGHAHAEDPLGTVVIGGLDVELAQGHGAVVAGEEGHLVVKLPYSDQGATVVRAWIGTEDRTSSYVGKGEYASDHDDYDVHADAPDPLPTDARWWIELTQPDGTKLLGSAKPIL